MNIVCNRHLHLQIRITSRQKYLWLFFHTVYFRHNMWLDKFICHFLQNSSILFRILSSYGCYQCVGGVCVCVRAYAHVSYSHQYCVNKIWTISLKYASMCILSYERKPFALIEEHFSSMHAHIHTNSTNIETRTGTHKRRNSLIWKIVISYLL